MSRKNNNKSLALSLLSAVIGMILLAYASVPLYSLFCKITGYGGTVRETKMPGLQKGRRKIKVTFDANVGKGMPWLFKPEQKSVEVITGEVAIIFYYAQNLGLAPIVGTAVYNVTPHKAGQYFNKIECFCFREQLLATNQSIMFPVSFFIDPALEEDETLESVNEITLSYSFFPVNAA